MRALFSCEFSATVRDAFTARGHDATSCDLLPSESPGKHHEGDILDILYDDWDIIFAFPPCTYLANSGVRWLYTQEGRWEKLAEGAAFFKLFLDHPCPKICIENPVMHKHALKLIGGQNFTQTIQPYQFGLMETKRTCLWLKGLEPLVPTDDVKEATMALPYAERGRVHYMGPSPERQKERARFPQVFANAFAEQWG